jgi:membrane peptidoglycan carboxypeptidase
MATGVATLADMGLYHPPTGILRVDTVDGGEIFKYNPAQTGQQVVDPRVAFIMASILSNDSNRAAIFGSGGALTLPGRLVAAKTGTAEAFTDAYTIGFTPAIASAFWFGNPDGTTTQFGYDAILAAAPAWHTFMQQAIDFLREPAGDWYGPPPGLAIGPPGVWLMPGTRDAQPPPPLPAWASLGSAAPTPAHRG